MSSTFVSYNGLAHPQGTADCAVRFVAILNEGEQVVAYRARGEIDGLLISQSGSQADLTAQIEAIQAAYVNGGDLILTLNDGSTAPSSILNANTLGGTRVIEAPSFPELRGAEWVTKLHWSAVIEAEMPTLFGSHALWSFEESFTFEGTGGPATDVIECVQGPPVPQMLRQWTAMRAIQEGKAVGYLGRWTQLYAAPFWPSIEQQQFRVRYKGSPRRIGDQFKFFPTNWRYTFKSAYPLDGEPNLWPTV